MTRDEIVNSSGYKAEDISEILWQFVVERYGVTSPDLVDLLDDVACEIVKLMGKENTLKKE